MLDVSREQIDLHLSLRFLLRLLDLFEGVAHDGNDHIQGGDLSEECSQDEQNVDKGLLLTLKVIHNELAKRDQVLVYEGIYHPVVKGLINNLVLIVSVRA